ncbi:hypothetical protein B4Q04_15270 [Zobellia sp. OII3]|nr:hypothetical protein B4Q04_15270 [Zobellia sp. OII3]
MYLKTKKMKKLAYSILMLATAFSFFSCEKDLMKEVDEGDWNMERNILTLQLQNQIGPSEIVRTKDDASITISVNTNGLDFKAVDVNSIAVSYDASTDIQVGDKLNFDNPEKTSSIAVRSKEGKELEWKVILKPFQSDLEGTWSLSQNLTYGWFVGTDGVDSWAWGNWHEDMANVIPEAGFETDNELEFVLEGVTDDGNLFGSFTNKAGPDGKYASFITSATESGEPKDFAYKFRKVPVGEGIWEHNLETNVVTFIDKDGNESSSNPLKLENGKLELMFATPWDYNWAHYNPSYTLEACHYYYYALSKK